MLKLFSLYFLSCSYCNQSQKETFVSQYKQQKKQKNQKIQKKNQARSSKGSIVFCQIEMAQISTVDIPPAPEERSRDSKSPTNVHQNSSLYVGDLDPSVTEGQLFELFSQAGPVHSIRICRDAISRRSLGYAYVNYNTTLDSNAAARAISALNYTALNGRPLRIMWSHRDPSFRKSGVGNIFIKNLDKTIDHKALHDTFSAFGNILSCKVALDVDGSSKGYGFVHFETEEEADLAVNKVNNMKLRDKIVYVGHFQRRGERPDGKEKKFTNIFIKNLPHSYDDKKVEELFKPFGAITSTIVMKDQDGSSRGFGFVNFEEAGDAARAVDNINETELEGHKVFCGRAQKRSEREDLLVRKFQDIRQERASKFYGMNLYVKNLADEVDDEMLREQFQQYGEISSCKVMTDAGGKSKGFGFVCFVSTSVANAALKESRGKILKGKPLYVSLAQRKELRQAQLSQHFTKMMSSAPNTYSSPNAPMYYNTHDPMYPPAQSPFRRNSFAPRQHNNGFNHPNNNNQARRMRGSGRARGSYGNGRPRQNSAGYGNNMYQPAPFYQPVPDNLTNLSGQMMPPMIPPPHPVAQSLQPVPSVAGTGQAGSSNTTGQLTSSMLASAPAEQQKQILGERLFPLVSRLQPGLAGKITGMLLEMDNSELLILLESSDQLVNKISEAIDVLKQHNAIPDPSVIREM
eukprot:TRINITY_DN538_c0_g1_i11.p1 TRINITY_DN538_c0_g1~~TRINITY_DN538_c0_g1_i11.p1  ORF type:complete len:688 (-),score=120.58 TRINITY_DN538_c0_g1_i11:1031-3094(-)